MTIQVKEYDVIPKHIQKKAWKEIHRLIANETRLRKWKALRCRRGMYRLRLNRSYRLVVAKGSIRTGAYEIMKHSTFDKRFR
ncbi:hypothetical protein [Marinomonas sp.]|uniref:ParE family toxin-like protein n=1 Tax=Marinomonas sp. TaxID=1904862 RepID=UPI003BAD6190